MSEFAKTHQTIEMLRRNKEVETRASFDFDARILELKGQQEKIAQVDCLDDKKVTQIVGEIEKSGESFLVMRDTLQRLMNETNYLHDWIESGVLIDIMNADLSNPQANKMSGKPWNKKNIRGDGLFEDKMIEGRVSVKEKEPENVEFLSVLAQTGEFPKALRVYGHEVVHSYQSKHQSKPINLRGILSFLKKRIIPEMLKMYFGKTEKWQKPVELQEVQANRHSNNPPERKNPSELFERFGSTGHNTEKKRLKKSIDLVDKFNALGFTVEELGELVQDHGGWDKSVETYPKLESILKKEMNKLGINDTELEKLVEIDRLERGVEREKVKRIVQEELKKIEIKNKISQI
ncbi:MAG: hypothetical protein HYV41_03805 [Candidatus Magasanikbacteria bacterium]|nr:hypothetical protein [Candidatus Magasanikbacteria bacterium]